MISFQSKLKDINQGYYESYIIRIFFFFFFEIDMKIPFFMYQTSRSPACTNMGYLIYFILLLFFNFYFLNDKNINMVKNK